MSLLRMGSLNATNQMQTLDLDHLQFRAAESTFSKRTVKKCF